MNEGKTKSTKKYRYTAEEVAKVCRVSTGYVKKIRAQVVALDSPKAQQVLMVDEQLYDGSTALLKEVERILN